MRALLASPLGFLIGLSLGALGGGGSILAVPALVYAAGQDPKAATDDQPPPRRRPRRWSGWAPTGGPAASASAPASSSASPASAGRSPAPRCNHRLDPDVLLLGFAGLMLVAAWRMLTGCPTCTTRRRAPRAHRRTRHHPRRSCAHAIDARTVVKVLVAGTAVGFLTGLFGVGGGFVIVPALALVLKLPMPEAIGTSLLVIAINSAVALSHPARHHDHRLAHHHPLHRRAIAGVLTGGRLADRLDPERSLRWFAGLLVAVAAYTAIRAGAALTA